MRSLFGVYRAVCLSVDPNAGSVSCQVPQVFSLETVTCLDVTGGLPVAGDTGWVSFESGFPDRPVWMSAGGGDAIWVGPDGGGNYATVIIFNGESNSGGLGENSKATAAELAPRPSVQIFDNAGLTSFQPLDIGTNNLVGHAQFDASVQASRHGWELGLANSVEAGQWLDDTVYLIKTGQGGSVIAQWNEAGAYWQTFLARTQAALDILRGRGLIPCIYFWYTLGINDGGGGPGSAWRAAVEAFFVRVRNELGYVPIFYSEFMAEAGMSTSNDAIHAMAASDNMLQIIDATGAPVIQPPDYGATIHWNYDGMKIMGHRMGAASRQFGEHAAYQARRTDMLGTGKILVPPPNTPPVSNLPSIVPSPSAVTFTEGGTGVVVSIVLNKSPGTDLIVSISYSLGIAVSKTALVFTAANWSVAQGIVLTSPDDGKSIGNRTGTVTLSSSDAAGAANINVNVVDSGIGPAAPGNTVTPAITGNTTNGSVLTCSTGTWINSPTGYTYQWRRDTITLTGETASTHIVISSDVGTTLVCAVTATNAVGSTTVISTGMTIPLPPANWQAYAWQNMLGATQDASNYLVSTGAAPGGAVAVGSIDATKPFEVLIEWTGQAETQAVVTMLDDDQSTNYTWASQVYVSSAYPVNGIAYSSIDGVSPASAWGWAPTFPCFIRLAKSGNNVVYYSSDLPNGPWTSRFTHTGRLTGKTTLYMRVSFVSAAAGQKIKVSYNADLVGPVAPSLVTSPALTGAMTVGSVITCGQGTWAGTPTSYTYQWKRDDVNIAGATTNSYTILAGDVGRSLSCTVTATNAVGSGAASSDTTIIGAPLVPVTWGSLTAVTSPSAGTLLRATAVTPAGAVATATIDVSQPFEIEIEMTSDATVTGTVVFVDDDATAYYTWPGSQAFVFGFYDLGGVLYKATSGGDAASFGSLSSFPVMVKATKSGNNVNFSVAYGGSGYGSAIYTMSGVLTGKTTCYLKALFAGSGANQTIKVNRS